MRILFLCTDSFGGHGGIALYGRDLAAALAMDPRVESITIVPRVVSGPPEPLPAKVRFLADAGSGPLAYARIIASLLRTRGEFDLVVCGHINLLPLAQAFSPRPLLFLYGIEAWKPHRRAAIRRGVGGIVSISRVTLERFLRWSRCDAPAFLLPNAIHLDRYGIMPENEELADRFGVRGRRVIMTVGRLAPEERYKGFDEVIEILPQILQTHRDTVYVVAGGGADGARLKEVARARGVARDVVFTGFVPENEKAALYSLADVYAMPSRGEGFGFVLLEAMACGIPVIASKHDGGREAVRDGLLGLLVDPSNPAELLSTLREKLDDARREVPEGLGYFAFERFVERTGDLVDAWSPR